jgi:3-phosphoshikimate 1-carboxyvinyltransferase
VNEQPGRPAAPRPIRPSTSAPDVDIAVPGSKSVTNRALLLAALAEGRTRLSGVLFADDTVAFAGALRTLGVRIETDEAAGVCVVHGEPTGFPAASADVWCGEAGTAARFLLAACAASHGHYRLDGADRLRERPLSDLLTALRELGAKTEPRDATRLPLTLVASGLRGGFLPVAGATSSQFVSALLLAAPLTRRALEIEVKRLVSRPYVEMTCALMERFGVRVLRQSSSRFSVPKEARYAATELAIEPDASSASYFFAAAALLGGRVYVAGVDRAGSLQGDTRFLDVLEEMGCTVDAGHDGVAVQGPAALSGLTVDMSDISDTFMSLAAIAPFADAPVTITNIANVRVKESDRIAAVEDNLRRLGVRTESGTDFLRIEPATPHGATIDCHSDHRVAMAFSVLGLRVPGVVIDDPACVAKTFPDFFDRFAALEGAA